MPLGCFPPFLKLEVPALVPLLYSRRSSGGLWRMKSSGCFHVEAETIRGGSLDTAPLVYNKLLRKEKKKKSFILSADAASLILNTVEILLKSACLLPAESCPRKDTLHSLVSTLSGMRWFILFFLLS